jgi:hypothetical protein
MLGLIFEGVSCLLDASILSDGISSLSSYLESGNFFRQQIAKAPDFAVLVARVGI